MNHSPIFIHSLFRAGSTYLFTVFRRSAAGYCCYQEPLHELAFFFRENPSGLNEGHGDEKALLLRHPKIDGSYFKELQDAWPAWKDAITEPIIYDAYFLGEGEDIGISYWRALAEAARGRPVFQECRTSGRIGAIKRQMGGHHIYLWRNPWDQWWSYKVTPYFDVANQLIIRARHAPEPVRLMMTELALPAYPESDLAGAFAFYGSRPLDSERSYLIFYMLWCLGLKEGTTHADLLLNIDRLSDSIDYRTEIQGRLKDVGIEGIDFSDCRIAQGRYLEKDHDFFAALEARVHEWLTEGGWTPADLDQVQSVRQRYQPALWGSPIESISPADMVEQAARARQLARRFETSGAGAEAKAEEAKAWAAHAAAKAEEADARAAQAEAREAEARGQMQQALEVAQQARELTRQAEARAAQAAEAINTLAQHAESQGRQLHNAAQKAETLQQHLNEATARAAAEQARVVLLQPLLERAEQRIDALERELADSRSQAEEKLTALSQQVETQHQQLHEAAQKAETLQQHLNEATARAAAEQARVVLLQPLLERAEQRIDALERELADSRSQAEEKLTALSQQVETQHQQLHEAAEKAQTLQQQLNEATARAAAEQARVEQLTAQLSEKEQALGAKRSELEQLHAHSQWLQNEWDAARAKIDELNHTSHHWWTVADGLNRELQSVYRSKSWRITWPLRKLMQLLKWLFRLPVRLVTGLLALPRRTARWLLAKAIAFVLGREGLKQRARRWLYRYPKLKAQLRTFARARGLIHGPIPVSPAHAGFSPASGVLNGNGDEFKARMEHPSPAALTVDEILSNIRMELADVKINGASRK